MKSNKEPGPSYLRRSERRRRAVSRLFLFIAIVVLALLLALFVGAMMTGEAGVAIVATVAILYIIGDKVLDLFDRFDLAAKRFSKGADAEEEVRAILAGLRNDDYFVLNDIPSPAGNIDHLVIARHGGVFVIETKSTPGRVEVSDDQILLNGDPMPGEPIRQVLRNAFWLKERFDQAFSIEPYVTAVLLFTDAFVAAREPVRGVIIARPQFLNRVLNTPSASQSQSTAIWSNRSGLAEVLSGFGG